MRRFNKKEYDRRRYLAVQNIPSVYVLRITESLEKYPGRIIYKVGSTNKIHYRLNNLGQSLFMDFELFSIQTVCCIRHSRKIERDIHKSLEQFRIKKEWFAVPENLDLVHYISQYVRRYCPLSDPVVEEVPAVSFHIEVQDQENSPQNT